MIEIELEKKLKELKTDYDNFNRVLFNLYEYTKYDEYNKKENLFDKEDIIEIRKLYYINKFYKIWSFSDFLKVIENISIVKLQSPYTTITELVDEYDFIYKISKKKIKK